MSFEEFVELFNLCLLEAAIDKDAVNCMQDREQLLRDVGLDSLDWSVALMYCGDVFGIKDDDMGGAVKLIPEGSAEDMYRYIDEYRSCLPTKEEAKEKLGA